MSSDQVAYLENCHSYDIRLVVWSFELHCHTCQSFTTSLTSTCRCRLHIWDIHRGSPTLLMWEFGFCESGNNKSAWTSWHCRTVRVINEGECWCSSVKLKAFNGSLRWFSQAQIKIPLSPLIPQEWRSVNAQLTAQTRRYSKRWLITYRSNY